GGGRPGGERQGHGEEHAQDGQRGLPGPLWAHEGRAGMWGGAPERAPLCPPGIDPVKRRSQRTKTLIPAGVRVPLDPSAVTSRVGRSSQPTVAESGQPPYSVRRESTTKTRRAVSASTSRRRACDHGVLGVPQ